MHTLPRYFYFSLNKRNLNNLPRIQPDPTLFERNNFSGMELKKLRASCYAQYQSPEFPETTYRYAARQGRPAAGIFFLNLAHNVGA